MIVSFYGKVREFTNGESNYSPASTTYSTLRELQGELCAHYGKRFETFINSNEAYLFLVNGKGVMMSGGLDVPVETGDKIDILPFIEAG